MRTPGEEIPYIAKWYNNKKAAVSLRFDDASVTHVHSAIPMLNRYGIKGTFMINPGRRSYKKFRKFWEEDFPNMGHRLGNHTWNHKGANSFEEADREIRSVAELIWDLYPSHSKLMVFASGGGEKWAGQPWEYAAADIRGLTEKYHLIDLYDGHHPHISIKASDSVADVCGSIQKAIESKSHQAFAFHRIGNYGIKDVVKKIIGKTVYTFSVNNFIQFLDCLTAKGESLWIGELVQIYKYETEYLESRLDILESSRDRISMRLSVATNPDLYDQDLSIIVPGPTPVADSFQIIDGRKTALRTRTAAGDFLVNVQPVNSEITIIRSF